MLHIKSLSKTYKNKAKRVEAIRNLTIDIKEKEFVALVGASGCGKTTLLKCIAGLIRPTRGELRLDGRRITNPDKGLGMVFQDFSLFPWLTVKENIEFGLKLRNLPAKRKDKIARHYLDVTGLNAFANTYPKHLSGGMKQRVAIARTLANNPKVILMDEPFGALDSLTRASMQQFLTDLWEKENKTIVFVTHSVEEALFLADKIHVLSKRPATIRKSFDVGFERPRRHSLKHSKEFFDMRNEIMKFLEN